ncbi:MAG: 23S rRNA (adenine(2503)-C(2))-methyltransferase RlmN [Chlorobi bacterium]|nr:23S rRNA (adenine(2503)-C(2))-methyltransferase RlmN [Chlorobiota bacterium]
MNGERQNIKLLDKPALEEVFRQMGQPAFRAKQVWDWLWNKGAESFEDMTNLPKSLRQILAERFYIPQASFTETRKSADGTLKNAVLLPDGMLVESVLIPDKKRVTACISAQVGCSLDCRFCATARLKRVRNLTYDEIVDQVKEAEAQSRENYGRPLTNIVFMGMGEPLLNYDNVRKAIEIITSPDGLGYSPRRITVSTAGIPKMIKRLADEWPRVKLAVSLHSAIDDTRTRLMPVNARTGGLRALTEALEYWYRKTKDPVTFEYILFKGINDDERHAKALIKLARRIPSKVNLIEYNPADSFDEFRSPDRESTERFRQRLKDAGIVATVRRSRGQDIEAACGQLAARYEDAEGLPKIPLKKISPFKGAKTS